MSDQQNIHFYFKARNPAMTCQQRLVAVFYALGKLGVNRLLTFDTIDNPVRRFCFDHDGELKAVKELHGGQWKVLGEAEE